jgi:GNAT superfamily N-acetyltransferase
LEREDSKVEITIRPGRLSDVPDETALNRAVDWCYDERETLAEYHDDAYEPSSVLIAECDGEVVGKLELFIAWKSIHGKFALIRRFVIASGWRGQGIGKKMLDAAIERAREEDCAFVELSVDVTNPFAHALYAREGFVEDRVEVLMRRPLIASDVSSKYPREAP